MNIKVIFIFRRSSKMGKIAAPADLFNRGSSGFGSQTKINRKTLASQ
jgi:hypothetical protein